MHTKRSAAIGLVGESLREVAVLVAVFAPLDAIVQEKTLTLRAWVAIVVGVVIAFTIGVGLEVRSQWTRS